MSYQQFLSVIIDNRLIHLYGTVIDYKAALNMYNNDEELQEDYPTCIEWFKNYVPNMIMDGI